MRGKAGAPMLRSKVAGAHGEEVQHEELYWQPVCLFSVSPEDISQTMRTEVTSCTRGDAKVVGGPQISFLSTCLLSHGSYNTPSIPPGARQVCRMLDEQVSLLLFVSDQQNLSEGTGTQGHRLTRKSFLFPVCLRPCKIVCV